MKIQFKANKKGDILTYDDEKPVATKVIVSNEKFSIFRAFKGNRNMNRNYKKYIAVLYEIENNDSNN